MESCDTVKWPQHVVSAGSSLAFKEAPAEGTLSSSNTQYLLEAAGQQVFNDRWLVCEVTEHRIVSKLLFDIFEYRPASGAMAERKQLCEVHGQYRNVDRFVLPRLLYPENSGIASYLEMLLLFGLVVVSAETITHYAMFLERIL